MIRSYWFIACVERICYEMAASHKKLTQPNKHHFTIYDDLKPLWKTSEPLPAIIRRPLLKKKKKTARQLTFTRKKTNKHLNHLQSPLWTTTKNTIKATVGGQEKLAQKHSLRPNPTVRKNKKKTTTLRKKEKKHLKNKKHTKKKQTGSDPSSPPADVFASFPQSLHQLLPELAVLRLWSGRWGREKRGSAQLFQS